MSSWSQAFQNVGGKSVDAWKDIEIFRAKESVILLFVVAALFIFVAMTGVLKGTKEPNGPNGPIGPKGPNDSSFAVTSSKSPKECYEACVQKHCMGGRCFADEDQKCRDGCNYPSGY